MNAFIFAYTLLILFACMTAAVLSLTAGSVLHDREFVPQALFFMLYCCDLMVIFQNEWLLQSVPFDPAGYYRVENAPFRIAFVAAQLACLVQMLMVEADQSSFLDIFLSVVFFVVASGLTLVLIPEGKWQQWAFYSTRQVFVAIALAWSYRRARKAGKRTPIRGFWVVCALVAAVFVEDCVIILAIPPSAVQSDFMLYLSERNFSENILMLYAAWLASREAIEYIRAR